MSEETSAFLFGRKFKDGHGTSVESFVIRECLTLEQASNVMHTDIIQSPSHSFLTPTAIFHFAKNNDGKFYFRDHTYTFVMARIPSVDSLHDAFETFRQTTPPPRRLSKIDLEVDMSFDESFD